MKRKSLIVQLVKKQKVSWFDFATNQGGDILLCGKKSEYYHKSDFNKLLIEISEWLGSPLSSEIQQKKIFAATLPMILENQLPSGDYFDKTIEADCLYLSLYDTEDGKEFRVWGCKNRKAKSLIWGPLLQYSWNHCGKKNSCRGRKIFASHRYNCNWQKRSNQ